MSTATEQKPLVALDGLSKTFDLSPPLLNRLIERKGRRSLRAVDGLNIDIPRGKTFALVGESGCGKSTVAKLVVGLHGASAGKITFDGTDLTKLAAADRGAFRKRIQMIFQDPYASLNPRWRVRDIIAEPLRSFGITSSKAEERAEVGRLLELVGLSARDGEKFPHEFSGGQRQRISIARAISSKPEFLVCDEPTSALDVSVQSQVLNLMRDLQDELGLTYLFISHDLAVVDFMSDYVGVMYLGRLVEAGPAERIFSAPEHPYTRLLMDTVPDITMGRRNRAPVIGEVPNPITPPPGCSFNPRCPLANDRCRAQAPEARKRAGGSIVACHAVEEGRDTPETVACETGEGARMQLARGAA
ncbi:MAG: ATP-binding cassette domain-containing protein [Marinovum algicola]|jgi:oligopeptide/dipeptide ABC transporter ATP-binding protein|uniref:Peptide/nickel transport system ATP-binding protein n=1 Tax=Marinovum algicola TaxID=42444 RepID=A0A975WCZ8_9RHOB|nr:oligopeptide/dipeptide ABC transporter ATP-binding protein [Marinovum algicola]SEJ96567.1 peptide/nickel transport system ATP-binding protein [Marinovum algicola]SLN69453.1 Oligopeptide transport ATP-binding protein OppF [Marinovum algicola]